MEIVDDKFAEVKSNHPGCPDIVSFVVATGQT